MVGDARGFYSIIIVSTFVGLALNLVGRDPIKAFVFTAVLSEIAAVPLLYLIARISGDKDILGSHTGGFLSRSLVRLTVGIMGFAAARYAQLS